MILLHKRYEWMGSYFRDLYIRYRYLILGNRILNWDLLEDPEKIILNKYFRSTSNDRYRNIINKLLCHENRLY